MMIWQQQKAHPEFPALVSKLKEAGAGGVPAVVMGLMSEAPDLGKLVMENTDEFKAMLLSLQADAKL